MNIFNFLWSAAVILVIYHHALYPLILKWLSIQLKSAPAGSNAQASNSDVKTSTEKVQWPRLTVIVPCFNEADVIEQKLHNLAFLDYPTDRIKILLVDDGSTDQTVAKINEALITDTFRDLSFELIEKSTNGGKVSVLNYAMSTLTDGLVVLSDTSALISIDALKRAATALRHEDIGVVCATYRFLEDGTEGEQRYWQYQTNLKNLESQLGSTLGAHGALYAFRAKDYQTLPEDTINDDFILPMSIVRQGRRCIYDTQMIAVELERADYAQDFARRKRIAAGNMQQALRLTGLLHPKYGAVAWNFASGKWLRAFMPFILLLLWLMSAWNPAQSVFVSFAFWAQVATYGLAFVRHLVPEKIHWPRVVNLVYYIVSAYVASGIGSVHYLLQPDHFVAWQRAGLGSKPKDFLSRSTVISKRLFDIVVASSALFLTLPLWPIIAGCIKLESSGPVFFRQMRIGRATPEQTDLFYMLKFRTMGLDAESSTGAVWASANDSRITKVGYWLRKTRLDELPQLFNVLRGEMSLIGPRPERPGIGRDLHRAIPFYAERTFFVTPGITGLAQVNQGYDTCLEDVKTKLLYDHAYALSLDSPIQWIRMDMYVAFKTIWVMISGRGQ